MCFFCPSLLSRSCVFVVFALLILLLLGNRFGSILCDAVPLDTATAGRVHLLSFVGDVKQIWPVVLDFGFRNRFSLGARF